MGQMTREAKLYINCVITAGGIMLVDGLAPWEFGDVGQFFAYLILGALGGALKFRLPGTQGSYSLGFIFILIGFATLSLPQTLLIGCTVVLSHLLWRPMMKPTLIRVMFNVASAAIAVVTAYDVAHHPAVLATGRIAWVVLISSVLYFLINTALIAGAISMVQEERLRKVLATWVSWAAPYYVVGATAAAFTSYLSHSIDWRPALLIVLPALLIHLRYQGAVEQRA